jgi:glutathione synthase/RimK-type ligase-like ATP-grasp enzyme
MKKKQPTIVIVCRAVDDQRPPFSSPYYLHAYTDLLLAIKSHGAQAYFSTREHYAGNGRFRVAYTADTRAAVSDFRTETEVQADIVYNKGNFADVDDIPTLNPPLVHRITSNKAETYAHFPSYQPTTMLCHSAQELAAELLAIPGDKVVLKTLTGNGGHGIHVVDRADALTVPVVRYPVLLQEFLDTACGIPGMVDGIHDLRVKVGDGKAWGGTLRTPAPGEFRANVAQGGSERHLFPYEIPKEAIAIAMEIDKYFSEYARYYSIDLVRTDRGWKLIELNSKPGLSPVDMSQQSAHITSQLAQYLIRLASEYRD